MLFEKYFLGLEHVTSDVPSLPDCRTFLTIFFLFKLSHDSNLAKACHMISKNPVDTYLYSFKLCSILLLLICPTIVTDKLVISLSWDNFKPNFEIKKVENCAKLK